MEIRNFEYASTAYHQALNIRDKVLRIPLGMSIYNENLEADQTDVHIGAFDQNQLIGCLILHPVGKGEIKMRQVAVRSEFQSQGIGKALIAFAEKMAIQLQYHKMILHARKVVIDFYEKLGYRTIGEEFTEVGIPHQKMFKKLIVDSF